MRLLLRSVTNRIFPSFIWQSICLLKVSVLSKPCSCSASCISPASLPVLPGSPHRGCQAPLKWRKRFITCHKKSFPFFSLNQTLLPCLEESCLIYLEEALCLCFKEGQKQKQMNEKPRVGYKDPQSRPPSQASLRCPSGCSV